MLRNRGGRDPSAGVVGEARLLVARDELIDALGQIAVDALQ